MAAHRIQSLPAWLTRVGFADPAGAAAELDAEPLAALAEDRELISAIGRAPDPDQALRMLGQLLEAAEDDTELIAHLKDIRRPTRQRLLTLLGSSQALADHLVRHSEQWREVAALDAEARPDSDAVREELLGAVGADPTSAEPVAAGTLDEGKDALRIAYRRHLLQIAALDLTDELEVEPVARELAELADATLAAALAVARVGQREDATPCRLAVIGMGKCGGLELNYVSDVDVIFVAEPVEGSDDEEGALRAAAELASAMMRVCSDHTAEGTIWPVDANLRPEGRRGPLVRTLASHLQYYRSWAQTWEFQALLKARPVAGDLLLGRDYVEAITPMVWSAAGREGFVDNVRRMRQRVEENVRPAEASREIKLGRGGLRDVEFAVQLLQLVHGRSDDALRSGSTLVALNALIAGGYIGRDDGARLDEAYRFLRTLEHRVQLRRLRRTHLVPTDDDALRALGRSLGLRDAAGFKERWGTQTREVRRLHEKIFYRPLLGAVAQLPGEGIRLSPAAARERLEALGYVDPAGALRHIEALTTGVSRRAAIQKTLLPVLLSWFADSPEPDAGLAGFRKVSDALGATPWYLRLLRDSGAAAERMARVLAAGRYPTELLLRSPEAVKMLGDGAELRARSRESLEAEVTGAVRRYTEPGRAIGVVRSVRRRELFRTVVADLVGLTSVEETGAALTTIAQVTLSGALTAAVRAVEAERGEPLPTRMAVIAMGRLGGGEMNYGSDADVLFVHDPLPGADDKAAGQAAQAVALQMRRLLSQPSPEPSLVLDVDLRPEGKSGPLVRSLAGYASYYRRWSELWERQALLRASPCCGDPGLLKAFGELIDPLRWPTSGLDEAGVRQVRRMKARIESERLPRGADRSLHLKLGPGGQSDVEWTVQLLQLRHAHEVPQLRTPHTVPGLQAATAAGLISEEDSDQLLNAWCLASRIRNATMIVGGRARDDVPRDPQALTAVSRLLGAGPGESAYFLDEYRRVARHARAVVERVFYDE